MSRNIAMVVVVAIVFGGAAGYLGGNFWEGEEEEKVVPAKELTQCEAIEKTMADAQTEAAFHYFRILKRNCDARERAAVSEDRDLPIEEYFRRRGVVIPPTPVPTPVTFPTNDNLRFAHYEVQTGFKLLEASGKRVRLSGLKYEISGVIKNVWDTESSVKVEFDVHDKDGYVLGTVEGWIRDVAPGRTHHFDAYAYSLHDGEVVEISLKKLEHID